MDKILSIIVPSYNMEAYLPKCLGGLVVVPDVLGLFEVLVVNDGSKDRTSEIAHEYADKYPKTFKVIDKENGNYGSCVNAGLAAATGLFVKVLDADDSFDPRGFSEFLSSLDNLRAAPPDLVITNYNIIDEAGAVQEKHSFGFQQERNFSILDFISSKEYVPMHAYTYRTNVLREIGYRQLEGVSYTDTEWVLIPLGRARTVRYLPILLYLYLRGREGQTMEVSKLAQSWWMKAKVVLDMAQIICREGWCMDAELRRQVEKKIVGLIEGIYRGGIFGNAGYATNIDLNDFDVQLKGISNELYQQVDLAIYSPFVPYHFIRRWRNHFVFHSLFVKLCRLYTYMRS